jgi:CRP-like cAMP-binding protein
VDTILALCADLPERHFPTGAELLPEGGRSGVVHVLTEGTVGVEVGGVLVKRVGEPGAFLGEIAALLDAPHSARVVALTDTRTRVMSVASISENPAVLLAIARLLAARLNAMTGYLVDLRNQYADDTTHLGLMAEVLSELTSVRPSGFVGGSDRTDVPDY